MASISDFHKEKPNLPYFNGNPPAFRCWPKASSVLLAFTNTCRLDPALWLPASITATRVSISVYAMIDFTSSYVLFLISLREQLCQGSCGCPHAWHLDDTACWCSEWGRGFPVCYSPKGSAGSSGEPGTAGQDSLEV